jgi:hypothetical protein
MFDELRQFELPRRTASVTDFVSDLFGIALGTLAGFVSSRRYSLDAEGRLPCIERFRSLMRTHQSQLLDSLNRVQRSPGQS